MASRSLVFVLAAAAACGDDANDSRDDGSGAPTLTMTATLTATNTAPMATDSATGEPTDGGVTGSASQTVPTATTASEPSGTSGPTDTGLLDTGPDASGTTETKFDVSGGSASDTDMTTGPPVDQCKVSDDMDAIGDCGMEAPADSFEPELQWSWPGQGGDIYAVTTPLVANLTDDNGDGEIDLCDVPDIVVAVGPDFFGSAGHIYVLDGATGTLHFQITTGVDPTNTPALGDIDGDGLPEIVAALPTGQGGNPVAFEHDGTLKWQSPSGWPGAYIAAFALADLDNDGDVEILGGNQVWDHTGALVFTAPAGAPLYSATAAADLDEDGDLEVVIGATAFHHDGSVHYQTNIQPGFPQVANLDGDPQPEVLVTNPGGLTLLEHDGAVKYQDLRPTGDPAGALTWFRPATVQDFNGDDVSDYAVSSGNNYTTYRADASIIWKAPVSDQSGIAAGTAFDFLGDGIAEAMYADEMFMFVFGGSGEVLLSQPRTSLTGTEYPIVADVDNDGSAEIVVVSNMFGNGSSPPVQVIRDKMDRWIQARRIWNQHTYHVTNVREDGTIPQFEKPSWKSLNTFRTNAQIEGGGLCEPPIPQ
ncbi:MAG: VCBS repeat-containing protein [Myxococcales bacterium]|nr:VCBS repeat-containing protein [Myxococcales bacterium]